MLRKTMLLAMVVAVVLAAADIAEQFAKDFIRAALRARAELVSRVSGAIHITNTNSGHYMHQERPALVIDSIRKVLDAGRHKAWCKKGGHDALVAKNQGQCIKVLNSTRFRTVAPYR